MQRNEQCGDSALENSYSGEHCIERIWTVEKVKHWNSSEGQSAATSMGVADESELCICVGFLETYEVVHEYV